MNPNSLNRTTLVGRSALSSAHASQISVNSVLPNDLESQRKDRSLDLSSPQFVVDISPHAAAV